MLTFSQVTFKVLKEQFGSRAESVPFLPNITPLPLPGWLQQYLAINPLVPTVTKSEKAISEVVIAPILVAVKEYCNGQIGIFSGEPLSGAGLVGICDFIITTNPRAYLPEPPIMVLVQAKRQDLLSSIPQCVAEMLAARDINRLAGLDYPYTYGCVTTGTEWQFLRLSDDLAITDPGILYFRDLEQVLGTFVWIINQFQ